MYMQRGMVRVFPAACLHSEFSFFRSTRTVMCFNGITSDLQLWNILAWHSQTVEAVLKQMFTILFCQKQDTGFAFHKQVLTLDNSRMCWGQFWRHTPNWSDQTGIRSLKKIRILLYLFNIITWMVTRPWWSPLAWWSCHCFEPAVWDSFASSYWLFYFENLCISTDPAVLYFLLYLHVKPFSRIYDKLYIPCSEWCWGHWAFVGSRLYNDVVSGATIYTLVVSQEAIKFSCKIG